MKTIKIIYEVTIDSISECSICGLLFIVTQYRFRGGTDVEARLVTYSSFCPNCSAPTKKGLDYIEMQGNPK